MNAMEFLTRAKGIKMRMEALEERIYRLKASAEHVTTVYEPRLGGRASGDGRHDYLSKVEEAQREHSELNIIYEDVIESIEHSGERQYRDVLRMYYLDCLTRKQIAFQMKFSPAWVTILHNKAIEQFRVPEKYANLDHLRDIG